MWSKQWQLGREMGTIPAFASRTQENQENLGRDGHKTWVEMARKPGSRWPENLGRGRSHKTKLSNLRDYSSPVYPSLHERLHLRTVTFCKESRLGSAMFSTKWQQITRLSRRSNITFAVGLRGNTVTQCNVIYLGLARVKVWISISLGQRKRFSCTDLPQEMNKFALA